MTCIVGIVESNTVYMAGDSAASNHLVQLKATSVPKVFVHGDFIFGVAGNPRIATTLHYILEIPVHPPEDDALAYLARCFVPALRGCLEGQGLKTLHEGEDGYNGVIMVGYQGRLFVIYSDFGIHEPLENYAAIGTGDAVALGALYATQGHKPRERLGVALRASANYIEGVREPFVEVAMGPKTPPKAKARKPRMQRSANGNGERTAKRIREER